MRPNTVLIAGPAVAGINTGVGGKIIVIRSLR